MTTALHTVESLVYFAVHHEFVRDEVAVAALLEIYDELTGERVAERAWRLRDLDLRSIGLTKDGLEETLTRAVRRGHLRVESARNWMSPVYLEEVPDTTRAVDAPESAATAVATLDWVGVLLRDQDGLPVADVRCVVTPAGRAAIECFTGPDGRAHIADIEAGPCTIEFPDLDAREWDAA